MLITLAKIHFCSANHFDLQVGFCEKCLQTYEDIIYKLLAVHLTESFTVWKMICINLVKILFNHVTWHSVPTKNNIFRYNKKRHPESNTSNYFESRRKTVTNVTIYHSTICRLSVKEFAAMSSWHHEIMTLQITYVVCVMQLLICYNS